MSMDVNPTILLFTFSLVGIFQIICFLTVLYIIAYLVSGAVTYFWRQATRYNPSAHSYNRGRWSR